MLANDLAEAVTDSGPTVITVRGLRLALLRHVRGMCRFGKGSDLIDRADANAIGFPQRTVHRSSFRHPHFCAVHERRNIGRIGIAVADESLTSTGPVDGRCERPMRRFRVTKSTNWSNIDPRAAVSTG